MRHVLRRPTPFPGLRSERWPYCEETMTRFQRRVVFGLLAQGFVGVPADAQSIPAISDSDFHRLHTLIKPQPGESPWRQIDWLTDVAEARRRAIAEDKPLVFFTAADGSPLGRT